MSVLSEKSNAILILPKDTPVWVVDNNLHKICTARVHTVKVDPDAMSDGSIKIVYTLLWSGLLYSGPTSFFTCEAERVFERTEEGTKAALVYLRQNMQQEYDKAKADLERQQRLIAGLEHYLSAPEQYCFNGLNASEYNQILKELADENKHKTIKKGKRK